LPFPPTLPRGLSASVYTRPSFTPPFSLRVSLRANMGHGAILAGLAVPTNLWDARWWEDDGTMFSPAAVLMFGAVFGFLCARCMGTWMGQSAAWLSSPPGTGVRRAALLLHGAVIIRDIWCSYTKPGTFRRYCFGAWEWLLDRLWGPGCEKASRGLPNSETAVARSAPTDSWCVTEEDLQFFKSRTEGELGAAGWKSICEKELSGELTYSAWFRILPNKKTEYKSVTVVRDVSAEEMMDFYLDDPSRTTWDGLISHHEILEQASFSDRRQIVRWKRSFPFNFITDREYIIGRRVFREGDRLYGVTKATEHPLAPVSDDIVRMEVYYSMWYTKSIPCPWGTDRKACEVVLLHHEQFKIPERLSRFTVCKGMWGFVKKMGKSMREFTAERRQRCDQDEPDMQAYGSSLAADIQSEGSRESTDSSASRKRGFRLFRTIRKAAVAGIVTTMVFVIKHKG